MDGTTNLISIAKTMNNKYSFVKTATISDLLFDCIRSMRDYLQQPMYQKMYGDPETMQKITYTVSVMTNLIRYLDTPPAHMLEESRKQFK